MDKRRICIILVLAGLGVAAYIISTLQAKQNKVMIESKQNTSEPVSHVEIEETQPERHIFPVYICGEVANPGIYQIEDSVYLYELIEMAGGLKNSAAVTNIDMVYLIRSEESVYIPSTDDVTNETERTGFFFPGREDETNENTDKVNINTADQAELSTLNGIGEKTAEKIISYRQEHGSFQTTEELMNVPGIGENKFAKIKEAICV